MAALSRRRYLSPSEAEEVARRIEAATLETRARSVPLFDSHRQEVGLPCVLRQFPLRVCASACVSVRSIAFLRGATPGGQPPPAPHADCVIIIK